MADRTKIEWTDATWNPIRARRIDRTGAEPVERIGWHCEKVSAGCDNCYAQGINLRLGTKLPFKPGHLAPRGDVELFLDEKMLLAPLRWKKPRRIFVNSMTDSFGRFVTDDMLDRIFALMALSPHHTYQVLTKRPERLRAYMTATEDHDRHITIDETGRSFRTPKVRHRVQSEMCDLFPKVSPVALNAASDWQDAHFPEGDGFLRCWPLPNVWLGTSIEDQTTANERIPHLLATPAAVRFVSAEPLLGPVDIAGPRHGGQFCDVHCGIICNASGDEECPKHALPRLDWVIAGGESGPNARPMHPDWPRDLRDQCIAAGVAFHFKQWGEWGAGSVLMTTGEQVFRAFPDFQTWVNKASTWVNGGACLDAFGRHCKIGADFIRARDEQSFPVTIVHRVGKKAAGRLLDGRTWDQMPGDVA